MNAAIVNIMIKEAIEIKQLYLKDVSFESPHAPEALNQQWQPNVDIKLHSSNRKLSEDNLYESVLQVTVTAKQNDITVFVVEVEQAGIFEIPEDGDEWVDKALQVECPNILFPFAREMITSTISKGGFPHILMGPINFESIYQQKKFVQDEPVVGKPH